MTREQLFWTQKCSKATFIKQIQTVKKFDQIEHRLVCFVTLKSAAFDFKEPPCEECQEREQRDSVADSDHPSKED